MSIKKKSSDKLKSSKIDVSAYQWDLEDLLKNKSVEDLIKEWQSILSELLKLYPTIFATYDNFKKWIKTNEKCKKISNRLFNYISNKSNEDLSDEKWIGLSQRLSVISNEYANKVSDYENRVYENEEKIKSYLKNKEISEYTRSFDNIFKFKKHNLSNECEKLLSHMSLADGGVEEMFSSFTDSEMKYDDAIDSKNKKHKIEKHADVMVNLKSMDRKLRHTSWVSFNKAFYDFKTTLTHSLYYTYLSFNVHAKIRKFDDYIHSTCFADEIDIKLINHIYSQVRAYKDNYQSYLQHRHNLLKKLLNVNEIEPWDAGVDLTKIQQKFEIETAKKIVLEALQPMGEEYLHVVQKAFNERWISWLPQKNKYSGAYSIGGTKGLDKFYILMNYDKTLNAVFTLIHELGHSLNSYYYSKHQKVYASITIFCAEIASITNEMLLNYYLLKKYQNDKQMRLFIIDELLSGFFATTTRQVIFSNFEWIMNETINNKKAMTYDFVSQTYLNLLDEYMGIKNKTKYSNPPYKYSLSTPLRIPHFYSGNFYVYKYAIGQVVAIIVAKKIIDNEPGFLQKYYKFLCSGTSLNPIDTIKILGIDLYKNDPWIQANKIIGEFINEFKKFKQI